MTGTGKKTEEGERGYDWTGTGNKAGEVIGG